ncbi:MAG: hypothetical protein AB1489_01130 [Acidobacteriota bacterium]
MATRIYNRNRSSRDCNFARGLALLAVATFACVSVAGEGMKNYTRTYKVSPKGAALTISNVAGSIKVKAWDKPEIKVNIILSENSLEVRERQTGNSVEIEVLCSKSTRNHNNQAHFDISAPQNCTLDLKCLTGSIQITSLIGRILAQTMEGEISLTDLQSPNITAKSIAGPIIYTGVLTADGIYNFHSGENTVDITLPASSTFTLMATTMNGNIDLGSFQLTDTTSQNKRVSGRYGNGGASLNLSTHRGQIRLHKR